MADLARIWVDNFIPWPLTPVTARVASVGPDTMTLVFYDQANNETGFKIERATALEGPYTLVADMPSTNGINMGEVQWTDVGLGSATTYFYLSEEFGLDEVSAEAMSAGFINEPLRDNWGGIAYAARFRTGKGAPYPVAAADTAASLPAAPGGLSVDAFTNPDTNLVEPYTQIITWNPVIGADGYLIWIKYGAGLTTASDDLV